MAYGSVFGGSLGVESLHNLKAVLLVIFVYWNAAVSFPPFVC